MNLNSEVIFETKTGVKVLALVMESLATGLMVHYEVIDAWSELLNSIKHTKKYCFKTGFMVRLLTFKLDYKNILMKIFRL